MRQEKSRNPVRQSRGGRLVTGLLCLVSFILTVSFFFFLISFIYGAHILNESAPPPLLGNKPDSITLLEKDKDNVRPFTFWVAGDPHKDDYLRILYPGQIKPQHPSFGIILGDIIVHPIREHHQYFWHMCRQWGIDTPMLLVLGNHDVAEADPSGVPDGAPEPFYLRQFEDTYGPTNFSFTYAGCLFIVLNDVLGGDAYVGFLKGVLEKEASDARMIFVFCHIPIRTDPDHPVIPYKMIDVPGFADLVKKYHIDYVMSGHYHSYARETLSGTTYLVSGGGTGLAERESKLLSHGIFFAVDPASKTVIERVMVAHEGLPHNILYHINRFAVLDFTPFIKSRPVLGVSCYVVNLLLLLLFFVPTVGRLKQRNTRKTAPKKK
jgi:predicted phosphodiesterase